MQGSSSSPAAGGCAVATSSLTGCTACQQESCAVAMGMAPQLHTRHGWLLWQQAPVFWYWQQAVQAHQQQVLWQVESLFGLCVRTFQFQGGMDSVLGTAAAGEVNACPSPFASQLPF